MHTSCLTLEKPVFALALTKGLFFYGFTHFFLQNSFPIQVLGQSDVCKHLQHSVLLSLALCGYALQTYWIWLGFWFQFTPLMARDARVPSAVTLLHRLLLLTTA